MKSFDVFDTLIGRWYKEPCSIFEEMETKVGSNFSWTRQHAERICVDKNLDSIYKEVQKILNLDEKATANLMDCELNLEKQRTFPIYENVAKLNPEDLIISDFYFNKDQLKSLLEQSGIKNENIFISYSGKRDGTVWNTLSEKPTLHTGDNYESDILSAQRAGIPVSLYTGKEFTEIEKEIHLMGYKYLACLMRATRLSFPNNDLVLEQANINLPVLIILSDYLNSFHDGNFLFSFRDCYRLKQIFDSRFFRKTKLFYSSRDAYIANSKGFQDYAYNNYNKDSLIVDLQGTGKTCFEFFRNLKIEPNYFTLVYSDLEYKFPSKFLLHRGNGFSDKIEKLNYINSGRVLDVKDYEPVYAPSLHNDAIELQGFVIDKAVDFLRDGFKMDTFENHAQLLDHLLRKVEKNCVIETFVKHEET